MVLGAIWFICPLRPAILKNKLILIEIANTPQLRQKGLQNREYLATYRGMLFVFETENKLRFWMKNTKIPLSIAFLNDNKEIVDIQQMEPQSLEGHVSARLAKYALEMNAGWFKHQGVGVGDRIIF